MGTAIPLSQRLITQPVAAVSRGNCPGTGGFWPYAQPPFHYSSTTEGGVQQTPLELRPGEYRVLLCVDIGETRG